jgi:hypothetical protein
VDNSFSRRYGFEKPSTIKIREDAPEAIRAAVIVIADRLGVGFKEIREVVCAALRTMPKERENWGPSNVMSEVRELVGHCPWYKVYDLCEEFYRALGGGSPYGPSPKAAEFETGINHEFEVQGIGWKIQGGSVKWRGADECEASLQRAEEALRSADLESPASRFREARRCLSQRPDPDVKGAISHAIAALEGLARTILGGSRTFGEMVKLLQLPSPLNRAAGPLWGYASEWARHENRDRVPTTWEAELVYSICAAFINFLSEKHKDRLAAPGRDSSSFPR